MPPEGLESSVDGLGRPVRAVGVVEEREDVRHAAFEGASERDESGASGRRSPDSEGFDELGVFRQVGVSCLVMYFFRV